jgi:hypothetical protein
MALTRFGLDDTKVHLSPPLCIPTEVDRLATTYADLVRCSPRLADVTCEACRHFANHPEERGDPPAPSNASNPWRRQT